MPDFDTLIAKRLEQKAVVENANKVAKNEKEALDEIDAEIMAALDAVGLEAGSGAGYTASINEEDVPSQTDWDTFYAFLAKTQQFHLLQRRISSTAWREYKEIYGEYPQGTEALTQRKLSFTKRRSRKKS